jgi:hypothetical protein
MTGRSDDDDDDVSKSTPCAPPSSRARLLGLRFRRDMAHQHHRDHDSRSSLATTAAASWISYQQQIDASYSAQQQAAHSMARHDSSMATDVPHDQDETGEHSSRFGAQWRNDELVLALLHAVQMDSNPIFQLSSWHTPVFAALTIGAWRDRRRSTIHILPVREREQHRRVPRHHAWWRPVV